MKMQFIEPHARNPSKIGLSGAAWTIQTRKQNLVTILFSIGIMVLFGFICVQLS